MRYAKIAELIFGVPLLMHEPKMRAILGALGPRMRFEIGAAKSPAKIDSLPDDGEGAAGVIDAQDYGCRVENGVARIPIVGPLVHRAMGIDAMSGGPMSYVEIGAMFRAAIYDANVHAILLEIDSGGGEANGAFDLADEIFAARGVKPIWAIANDWACSGAYLLAASAEHVVATQTGEIGSVGVVWCHVDYSKQNEMLGEAVTYLYAGQRKVDGWPDKPLSAPARQRFQADVDKTYALFVDKIAQFRSMSADAVRATEALTYSGGDGVAIGFVDEIGNLQDTMTTLAALGQPSAPQPRPIYGAEFAQTEESVMNTQKAPAGAEPAGTVKPDAITTQSVDAEALRREASTQATAAERTRIAAIMDCEEAKGREDQARHLAFKTSMSPEDAKAILATAPKAEAAAPKLPDALQAAMGKEKNPQVGADAAAQGEDAEAAQLAGNIISLHRGEQKRSA